uniref:Si:dkey-78k11.9 n=1 Tax=Callorhinchus milii TaxID=7868 RepID=A0A4W3IMI6_CALMI
MIEQSTAHLAFGFQEHSLNRGCQVNKTFRFQYLPPIYIMVFVVGFLGNCWALLSMRFHRVKWTGINVFLCNLALADLLYVITLPFLVVYYASRGHWIFGTVFCRATRLLFHLNLHGSIGFLTCISVQRYLGIVHPMRVLGRVKTHHSVVTSVVVWLVVVIQTATDLYFSKTNPNSTKCYDTTFDDALPAYITYSLTLSVVGFLLPFAITLGCYAHVVVVLTRNPNVDPILKSRCLRLVAIVTVLFSFCFTPYHVLRNANLLARYLQLQGSCTRTSRAIYMAYQVSRGLASLNSAINPLVYFIAGDEIKSRMQKIRKKLSHSLSRSVTWYTHLNSSNKSKMLTAV